MKLFLISLGIVVGLAAGSLGSLWAILSWPIPVLDSIAENCANPVSTVVAANTGSSVSLCSLAEGFVVGQLSED